MKKDGTNGAAPPPRLLPDGSIDHAFYAARARALRAAMVVRLLRALATRLRPSGGRRKHAGEVRPGRR